MSDLIQRQDAINAIGAEIDELGEHIKKAKLCIGKDAEWIERFADYRRDGLIDAVMSIESLPSAGQNCVLCEYYTEIETDDGIKGKCKRRTGSDLISRQDAVEALEQEIDNATPINGDLDSADGHYRYALRLAKNIIKSLPSADIEEDIARRIATIIENEQDMRVILKNADPKTGWIPVSEKPKDEERTYLVQLDGGGMCSCRWTNANPIWTELTTDWHWNIFDIPQYCKVVAWMDLEPYREDGEV